MYSVFVLFFTALLIDGVRTRQDLNLKYLSNFEVSGSQRTIEVKEPGVEKMFGQQDNYRGGNFGGDYGGDDDDWVHGGKRKHKWFGRNKDGRNDGYVDGKMGSAKSGENRGEGRWNRFIGDKMQNAMSSMGIKGHAQTAVVRGAIQTGVLNPDMAPPGTKTHSGFLYYLFYPINIVLGFSNLGPFAKPSGVQKWS